VIICKRSLKGMAALVLLLVLNFLFSAAASAATVSDVANNSLRIGDDIYELNHTTGYTYDNVLASLGRGGQKYYFKIDNRWYDLTREDIKTLSDLLDLEKAVPAAEVRTWVLDYRYGAGNTPEELEPLPSTYYFEYCFPGEAILESEDTGLTVALSVDKQGAIGYDAAHIAFSAAGPGEVTFKTVDDEGEHIYENEGMGEDFSLPADYEGSTEWTLCFSSAGNYTITFQLVEQATGRVIAEGVLEIRVYPAAETVLAGLEARIRAALESLGLGETGVSSIDYAEGEALVRIDEPDRLVNEFMQSLADAFKEPLDDVAGAAIYVDNVKAGAIENPAAMSDAELIEAIGEQLIRPLTGGEKPWSETVLGDLEGKSAVVELTVALGAAEYSAYHEVSFAINRYSVSVVAENGTVQGVGSFAVGAEVNLEAIADDEYVFYSWGDGEGEEVSKSNPYSFAMPNRELELIANFFRSEAIVDQDSTLNQSYMRVDMVSDDLTVDLGGNTVVHLSIAGSNVTLQNGTVVNLKIERGVENVVLDNIHDLKEGNHNFAGGGGGSVVLKGDTALQGTIQITSRDALGICSQSAGAVIGGDVIVKTIRPVAIAAPVRGEIRVLAAAVSITIQSEVSRITALADTVIKISSSIDEPKRPLVERAGEVEVSVHIVDEYGEETGETAEAAEDETLIPADVFIFSIDPVTDESKVNGNYILPATVKAVLSDGSRENVAVLWDPAAVDTGAAGLFSFSGTVEGYDEAVELVLTVYLTHMVAFDAGEGTSVGAQEIRHGEAVAEPAALTRVGYTFGGWFKDGTCTEPWRFAEDRVTEALTLHARWVANIYEVIFDAGGGEGPNPARMYVTFGSAYGDLAETFREGHTFAGWYTKAAGGEKVTADDKVANPCNHTLYAHWDINQYTITFDSAGGSEIEPLTQDYGTAIAALADPVKEGYDFEGWQPALPETMPAENLVLTAQWNIKTYTVTFVDHDGTVLDTQTVEHGKPATAPADPERDGYTFTGWDQLFDEITGDLTVTARYEAIDYTLTIIYKYTDGSEAAKSHIATLNIGDGYEVVSPQLTGYTADKPTVSGTMPAGDVTITVTYTINRYTVTFVDHDGTTIDTQTVDHGGAAAAPADPEREGYIFTGWDQEFANVTRDLTVTAVYVINEYTVTFVDHDGTVLDTQTVEHGSAAAAPAVPGREGYTFTGWDLSFERVTGNLTVTARYEAIDYTLIIQYLYTDGSEAAASHGAVLNIGDSYEVVSPQLTGYTADKPTVSGTMPAGDVTITVTYTINRYTVTFVDHDGTTIDTQTVDHGGAAAAPADPEREGYTFTGWDQEFAKVNGDLTVTAVYVINEYTVTFVDHDGTVLDTQTVEHGKPATAPTDPERDGYTFTGWDQLFDEITGDLTVTACYEAIDYTLTIIYKYTDGSEAAVSHGAVLNIGDSYEVVSPLLTGYTADQPIVAGTMPAGDVTITVTYTINCYTVTFVDHDETVIDTQMVDHGGAAVAPTDPEREGYTFTGWDQEFDKVTGDLTVTAVYVINEYTVTFVDHDGTVLDTQTVEHGKPATAPTDPERDGYTFTGWDQLFDEITGDLTVTACYEAIDYTLIIQYLYTDGSEAAASHGAVLNIGDSYEVVSPLLTGYTADQPIVAGTMPAGDVTITVTYTINRYTVTFVDHDETVFDTQMVDHGGAAVAPTDPEREGYTFTGWDQEFDKVTGDLTVTAVYVINEYTVTFVDYDGAVLDTQTVEHGSAAAAPADPEREGYAFNGWDTCFEAVESDLTVTAKYIDQLLVGIRNLIDRSKGRTRPGYTAALEEWDLYWGDFSTALEEAEQLYAELEGAVSLTEEQKLSVIDAEKDLQRAVEILDGIEDFDLALGGREHPKGLVETVYERSLVSSDGYQPGRMRCYYEKESGKFSWMLSGFVQEQGLYEGTTGTGMNPGLQNVMLSDSIVKLQSGELVVNIYHPDGTRKTKTELENNGIALATYWLEQAEITHWIYKSLVGLVEDCKLIGRTSDGTEFARTYSFRFIDGETYLFDRHFRYCVVDDVVQKDFEGYSMINVTRGLKYSSGPIQAALDEAEAGDCIHLAAGNYNESITINKSINLIGNYREGIGAHATVLDGAGIGGAPGIRIAEGVENVSIQGFEIKGFDSGGIAGEGGGISNVIIENNFIHDLEGDAVVGKTGAAQPLTGWTVAGNRIDNFGGSGIAIENIGSLVIRNNQISRNGAGEGLAIGVTVRADSGALTLSGITIKDNEIADCAVNVTVLSEGSGEVMAKEIAIDGNTLAGGSIEVQTKAEGYAKKKATIEYVSVSDNHIEFSDKGISVRNLATPGDAHLRYITIKNNELTGRSTGIELHTEGGGYNNLRESTITGNNITVTAPDGPGCAVSLTGVKGSANFPNSFSKNSVTITGSTGVAFDGIHFSGKDTGNWNVTDNTLNGNGAGSAGSGIRLSDDLPAAVDLNMSKNRITGWAQGILAGNLAGSNQVKIQRNWIYGNTDYGVANGSGALINATLNYWGHAGGPHHASNSGGAGNGVTDNVSFDPWYLGEDFKSRSDGGIYNVREGKIYPAIQAALDAAEPGDTIRVGAGIYNENLTITRSVTLSGDTGDPALAGPGPNAPIVDGTGKGKHVSGISITGDAKNVVIEGFEIRNFTGAGASGVIGDGASVSDVTVRYNHIHHVADNGVSVSNAAGAEAAAGWNVANNKIEYFGGSGIYFLNAGESLISKNEICSLNEMAGNAMLIEAGATGGQMVVRDIEIEGNIILDWPGSAICIEAGSTDASSAVVIEDIAIAGNTIECTGQAISWQAGWGGQSVLKNFAVTGNTLTSPETVIEIGCTTENVQITGNSITSDDCAAVGLGHVNGTGVFSNNIVTMGGANPYVGIWISGDGDAAWVIEDNDLDGSGVGSFGLLYEAASSLTTLVMNRNTITGWGMGVAIYTDVTKVTLRANRIFGGGDWGVYSMYSTVDARYNYWGDEGGPGSGAGITPNVLFDPWYIDEACTETFDGSAP
jgi:uncharacterized repeat protein (TIGR02543 family)